MNERSFQHPALDGGVIASLALPNRAVVAPMTRVSAGDGNVPTPSMASYYRRFAEGGFGLIITEGTYTDPKYAQGYNHQPGIVTPAQVEGWRAVVDAVHQAGGKILLQLMHAGALSQHLQETIGPSAIQPLRHKMSEYGGGDGPYARPRAMTPEDIDYALQGFVSSAHNAEEAGFDGVEIHGANGYLLDQFLTAYTNQRNDSYGGSVIQRTRFLADIIHSVKVTVRVDFVVGIRLSQGKVNDFDYRWPGGVADAKVIFPAMKSAGADYIHFASEGMGYYHGCFTDANESLPKVARELTDLPVIANGGMHDPSLARKVLINKEADFIALATGALVNPDWPRRLKTGAVIAPFPANFFAHGVRIDEAVLPSS